MAGADFGAHPAQLGDDVLAFLPCPVSCADSLSAALTRAAATMAGVLAELFEKKRAFLHVRSDHKRSGGTCHVYFWATRCAAMRRGSAASRQGLM